MRPTDSTKEISAERSSCEGKLISLSRALLRGMLTPANTYETPSGQYKVEGSEFTLSNIIMNDLHRSLHPSSIRAARERFMRTRADLHKVERALDTLKILMLFTQGLRMWSVNVNLLQIPTLCETRVLEMWNDPIEQCEDNTPMFASQTIRACNLYEHVQDTVQDEFYTWLGSLIDQLQYSYKQKMLQEWDEDKYTMLNNMRNYLASQLVRRTCIIGDHEWESNLTRMMFKLDQLRNDMERSIRANDAAKIRILSDMLTQMHELNEPVEMAQAAEWFFDKHLMQIVNDPPVQIMDAHQLDDSCFPTLAEAFKKANTRVQLAVALLNDWFASFGRCVLQATQLALQKFEDDDMTLEPQMYHSIPTIQIVTKKSEDERSGLLASPRHVRLKGDYRIHPMNKELEQSHVYEIGLRLTLIVIELLRRHEFEPMTYTASFIYSKALVANAEHNIAYRILWDSATKVGLNADLDYDMVHTNLYHLDGTDENTDNDITLTNLVYGMAADCSFVSTHDLASVVQTFERSIKNMHLKKQSYHFCQILSDIINEFGNEGREFAEPQLLFNATILFIPPILKQRERTNELIQLSHKMSYTYSGPLSIEQRYQLFYFLWSQVIRAPIDGSEHFITQTQYASLPVNVQQTLSTLSSQHPYIISMNKVTSTQKKRRVSGCDVIRLILFPFRLLF